LDLSTSLYSLTLLILIGLAVNEYYTFFKTGVPTIRSWAASRQKMVALLKAEFATRPAPYQIIDLGSGNGILAIAIARALPNATVVGIELSPLPHATACLRQRFSGLKNLRFIRQDFWTYALNTTDAIVFYQNSKIIERLSQKLAQETKPGALILSNEVHLSAGWQPIASHPAGWLKRNIMVYRR